jgi:hypothetical protein
MGEACNFAAWQRSAEAFGAEYRPQGNGEGIPKAGRSSILSTSVSYTWQGAVFANLLPFEASQP